MGSSHPYTMVSYLKSNLEQEGACLQTPFLSSCALSDRTRHYRTALWHPIFLPWSQIVFTDVMWLARTQSFSRFCWKDKLLPFVFWIRLSIIVLFLFFFSLFLCRFSWTLQFCPLLIQISKCCSLSCYEKTDIEVWWHVAWLRDS